MKRIGIFLLIALLIIGCNEKRVDEDRGYLQNELSVKFKALVSKEEINSIVKQYDSKIIKESTDNTYRIQIPSDKSIDEMKKIFESLPQVESVSLIREVQVVL